MTVDRDGRVVVERGENDVPRIGEQQQRMTKLRVGAEAAVARAVVVVVSPLMNDESRVSMNSVCTPMKQVDGAAVYSLHHCHHRRRRDSDVLVPRRRHFLLRHRRLRSNRLAEREYHLRPDRSSNRRCPIDAWSVNSTTTDCHGC